MDRKYVFAHDGGNRQGHADSKPPIQHLSRLKTGQPTQIDIAPYSAPQVKSNASKVTQPLRRKPLPPSASPSPVSAHFFSTEGKVVAVGGEESNNLHSAALTGPASAAPRAPFLPSPSTDSPPLMVRDLDAFPRGASPNISQGPFTAQLPLDPQRTPLKNIPANTTSPARLQHVRLASDPISHDSKGHAHRPGGDGLQRSATMATQKDGRPAPLHLKGNGRSISHESHDTHDFATSAKPVKTPGPNMLSSLFGWKASTPAAETSPTNLSDGARSPGHSPFAPSPQGYSNYSRAIPQGIDVMKANAPTRTLDLAGPNLHAGHQVQALQMQLDEMEEELKEISSELAGSIRREMELEDQVERYQLDSGPAPELSRRTSDYFSDSGTSSVRYPPSDVGSGNKTEDLEKLRRRSEQEKAQLKVDLSQKLQDERARRKSLESHVSSLEEQLETISQENARSSGSAGRAQELEVTLEDHRRRLQEERKVKENFQDLSKALKGELERHRNERDNLRDEVVPGLRARVEGLEAEAADFQRLTYEHSKMQQDLLSAKNENRVLKNQSPSFNSGQFGSIAEEGTESPTSPAGAKMGLSRSNSLARGMGGGLSKLTTSLSRSNSISSKERESRESLADRVKDIELQRDSLHRALRSLLERQRYQTNEHEKRVNALEIERDRALQAQSPRRLGYEQEVTGLRHEINHLRRRADEALEQKWQCEKGLGGLKKDLDRAEQETSSLRGLLHENDIPVPNVSPGTSPQNISATTDAMSASLESAFQQLKASQAASVARLRDIIGETPSDANDTKTGDTMKALLETVSNAEAQRDFAEKQAASLRAQAESLKESSTFHEGENAGLADQLKSAASRAEALAGQVRYQLDSNSGLRHRLADAIGRGEREQKASATQIMNMQGKLKALEDRLVTAQQHSEEKIVGHEEEVRGIRESRKSGQLRRLKSPPAMMSLNPHNGGSKLPSPMRSPLFHGAKSPKLDQTTSGSAMSIGQAMETEFLGKRVAELEGALGEADGEMEEVVQRMNKAQIEVLELQSARDEAIQETKKLQAAIVEEREKVDKLMNPNSATNGLLSSFGWNS